MGENTKIQWADHTFNPWRGCTKVAPGCANCYADAQSKRNPGTLGVWGPNGTRVLASAAMWRQPVRWDQEAGRSFESWKFALSTCVSEYDFVDEYERPRVFCASLADVFEDWQQEIRSARGEVLHRCRAGHVLGLDAVYAYGSECVTGCNRAAHPMTLDDVRARLFALIDATPNLDWLLLTKRPQNVRRMWCSHVNTDGRPPSQLRRANVWLGTSIACQEDADRNIPELLKCRDLAAKLFVSAEPLIGPVDLSRVGNHDGTCANRFDGNCLFVGDIGGADWSWKPRGMIDQIIIGGESGPHARPCNVDWVRSLILQCQDARVACFVKQLGAACLDNDGDSRCEWPGLTQFVEVSEGCKVKLIDHKGGEPSEWPEDLRVREVPA